MTGERLRRFGRAFLSDTSGVTAIEYALVAALIFCVILVGVGLAGESTKALYETVAAKVLAVMP